MEIANSSMDGKILIFVGYSFQKTKFSPLVIDVTSYLSITMRNTTCEISTIFFRYVVHEEQVSDDGSTTVGNYHIESLHETPCIVLLQVGVNNPHQRRVSNKKK